jgi:hypothetical protein
MNGRDLHENNVLVTKRFNLADAIRPEENRPVLIDFGRGSVTRGLGNLQDLEVHSDSEDETDSDHSDSEDETGAGEVLEALEPSTIAQDIQAYGVLIWELTLRWTKLTNHTMIPTPLIDLIAECMSPNEGYRPTMRDIMRSFDRFSDRLIEGSKGSVSFTSRMDAKMRLNPLLSNSAKTVPKPSAHGPFTKAITFSHPKIREDEESSEEEDEGQYINIKC